MKKVTFLLSFLFLTPLLATAQDAPVLLNDGYYLIDEEGDTLTKYAYDYIHPRSGSTWLVIHNSEFNYINPYNYRKISKRSFHSAYPFNGKFGLVGLTPHYHYISEKGVLFDTLDYALEPKVYGNFLIYGDSVYRVVDVDGTLIHRSTKPLFIAAKVGIFEWDKAEKRVIQYSTSARSMRQVRSFENVDTLAFNHQGYAFIEQEGKFCVPSASGQLLFENQTIESSYYLGLKVMWGKYLFLNRVAEGAQRFENEISAVPLYNSAHCMFNNYPNSGGVSVELSDYFESIDMARLPGGEKWVRYNGHSRQVEGRYLFNEVLPSNHNHLRLVRLGMEWFLYNARNEELQKLPWRFIHPFGLQEGRFFGSNSSLDFWEKSWSYQNLDSLNGGPEVYHFIKPKLALRRWHPHIAMASQIPDINRIAFKGDTFWMNTEGELIAQELAPNPRPHQPLDYIKPELFLNNNNVIAMESRRGYARRKLGAYLKPVEDGILIELANTTKDSALVKLDNGSLGVQLEYRVNDSLWRAISHSPYQFNEFEHYSKLAPNHKYSKLYRPAPGNFLVWVRLRVTISRDEFLLSEPIRMRIPAGQILGHRVPNHYALGAYEQLKRQFARP